MWIDIGCPIKTFQCPTKKSSKAFCLVVLHSILRIFLEHFYGTDEFFGTPDTCKYSPFYWVKTNLFIGQMFVFLGHPVILLEINEWKFAEFQLLNSFKKSYLRNDRFLVKNRCRIFFPLFLPDIRDYQGATDKKLEKGHLSFLKRVGNRTV